MDGQHLVHINKMKVLNQQQKEQKLQKNQKKMAEIKGYLDLC